MEATTINRPTSLTFPPSGGGVAQSAPLWEVRCQVLRTDYVHTWRGLAISDQTARDRAKDDARRQWPGFSFCVRYVRQVGA